MPKRIPFCLALGLTALIPLITLAQPGNDSPYSHYGVGNLIDTKLVRYSGMGGLGVAIREDSIPYAVNFFNPASYTGIKFTSFDIAAYASMATLSDQRNSEYVNKVNLSYFALGFPIAKWCGAAFGLRNFSTIGYNLSDTTEYHWAAGDSATVRRNREGTGGMDQFFIGAGFKPFKNFSIGFNASFMFGTMNRIRRTEFLEQFYFSEKSEKVTQVYGFYLDYGLQYVIPIKGRVLTLGAWGASPLNVSASFTKLSSTYRPSAYGDIPRDTVVVADSSTSIHLPLRLGFGITALLSRKFTIGVEYKMEQWSQFRDAQGRANGMGDAWRAASGIEFRPSFEYNKRGFWSYFGKMQYRLGGFYAHTQYLINGAHVPEYGITFGMGFPVSRIRAADSQFIQSMINLSVEWGQRGTKSNGLVLEDYWKIKLGFTLNDRWFIKRKYF